MTITSSPHIFFSFLLGPPSMSTALSNIIQEHEGGKWSFHGCYTNCIDTNINDEEDQNSFGYDGHHETNGHAIEDDDCNDYQPFDHDERTLYWESQEALLQEILEQYSSSGSKSREELSSLVQLARNTKLCECLGLDVDDCSKCSRRAIVNFLRGKGINASICTSMWKKTHSIPGGRHEYIEVIASTQGKKRKIRFLIEIEFRDEFKMANACEDYNKLIEQLPETYIGKPEHLNAVVRVMCDAAKRSTAERNIHLGPWRKMSFMQMKWSASNQSKHEHQSSSSANKLG
ncbi:uncharacterized protein [Coffea arabica]|uniref:Uncharacterized protein isoform X2 n=1 Tax=Coffea arabica TaxID=13443 RepID=A0A6P6UNN9_COFAR|nr:uncharacterized protein LOC113712210 isoform X2 [Coffea arabica]